MFDISETQLQPAATKAATTDSKACFSKLPLELRNMIWNEHATGPTRWLPVAPELDEFDSRSPPMTVIHSSRLELQSTPLTTMGVCLEAKAEVLRKYFRWRTMTIAFEEDFYGRLFESYWLDKDALLWINPISDIFVFGAYYRDLSAYGMENAAAKMTSAADAKVFGKIQHLAVIFPTLDQALPSEKRAFLAYLSNFSTLKDLTIIIPEDKDGLFILDSYNEFKNPNTLFSTKLSGLVYRYIERLFKNYDTKMPTINVIFETNYDGLDPKQIENGGQIETEGLEAKNLASEDPKSASSVVAESWDNEWQHIWGEKVHELEEIEASLI